MLSLRVVSNLCYQMINSRSSKMGFGFEKDKSRVEGLFTGVTKIIPNYARLVCAVVEHQL